MNILISAFAINPYKGSEPGLGWHWVTEIAKYCNVFVICSDEFKTEVLTEYEKLKTRDKIKIVFNHISPRAIDLLNHNSWWFYHYYRKWQKETYKIAKEICLNNRIDIIHQLSLTCFREAGYLWKIEGPKYVWGPVDGMNPCPINYIKGVNFQIIWRYRIKNILNWLQLRFDYRVRKAAQRADLIYCDSQTGADTFNNLYGVNSIQINEAGCTVPAMSFKKTIKAKGTFDILWVGRFIPTKLLDLLFKSVSLIGEGYNIRVHIVGWGELEQKYRSIATQLGVEKNCVWHGRIPHEEVESIMRKSDLFFFTSVVEGTPSVIMESISNKLPILCFNTCGFGPMVDESIGVKINLSTPSQSAIEFAEIIKRLYNDRSLLSNMSENCEVKIYQISWQSLGEKIVGLYKKVLD